MVCSLERVPLGRWSRVVAIETSSDLTQRLRDFGLVRHTQVRRVFTSPHADVTAIAFRGSMLAVRTRDLRRIRVQVL